MEQSEPYQQTKNITVFVGSFWLVASDLQLHPTLKTKKRNVLYSTKSGSLTKLLYSIFVKWCYVEP